MWLNKNNYEEYLKGISIVEVSGESCANCLSLMPIVNSIVSERDDCKLYHIEASDDTLELMEKFQVMAVPTILVMYNLEVKAKCKGFQPEEILEIWLDAKIEEIKKEYNL